MSSRCSHKLPGSRSEYEASFPQKIARGVVVETYLKAEAQEVLYGKNKIVVDGDSYLDFLGDNKDCSYKPRSTDILQASSRHPLPDIAGSQARAQASSRQPLPDIAGSKARSQACKASEIHGAKSKP